MLRSGEENNKRWQHFDRKVLRQVVWKERVFTYLFEKNNFKCVFIAKVIIALLNYINYSPPPSSLIQPLILPAFEFGYCSATYVQIMVKHNNRPLPISAF